MKKRISIILTVVITIVAVLGLAACGKTSREEKKQAVCFVIANTANSKGLNLGSPMVHDAVFDVIYEYGTISVVNVDSQPELVFSKSFDIDEKYKQASTSHLKADARSKTSDFIQYLQGIKADDPEVDYLAGLAMAVRSFATCEPNAEKTIIVVGTGMTTTGIMDFRQNLLSAEAKVITELLAEKEAIPDFTGITVVWQQLGDVALPQQELTSAQHNRLEEIYRTFVESGNGTFICNEILANPVDEAAVYPEVSVVELPQETPLAFEPENTAVEFSSPVVISEEQVCFVPDSAEYLYSDEAVERLKPIAEYMLEKNQDITLLLAGCIAGDSNTDLGYRLSEQRASAVKQTLMELGVPENRLVAVGMGCSDPWHIYEVGYEGPLAAQNRKVVLLDLSSEAAQEITAER